MNLETVLRIFNSSKSRTPTESGEESIFRLFLATKQYLMSQMERAMVNHLSFLNQVMPLKREQLTKSGPLTPLLSLPPTPSVQPVPEVNGLKKNATLSEYLMEKFESERQTNEVYELKVKLRQRLYSLLTQEMKESIDLYIIGSSQTGMASKASDLDLCLLIYSDRIGVDPKYNEKEVVVGKLEELKQTLDRNGMASKLDVIPASVPILKFTDLETDIEVNLNINKADTIRNTHLLYIYGQIDPRVKQLVLLIKIWAQKKGIKSAFNNSLSSYSISLMVIHFLQRGCSPPVVPCLQKEFPELFPTKVSQLRLAKLDLPIFQINTQDLGQLYINFFEYYTRFDFNYVISVRTGGLIDRHKFINAQQQVTPENKRSKFQWNCHICIEEPFTRSNTSHAVHDCRMFRQIVQSVIETYEMLVRGRQMTYTL